MSVHLKRNALILNKTQLTPNFALHEYAISRQYPHLAADVIFSEKDVERIRFASAAILEPLREHFKEPVVVTSGKRTQFLNSSVGGHPQSHHLFQDDHGAVDIVLPNSEPEAVARWLVKNTVVRLAIAYCKRKFVHISFPDSSGRRGELIIKETKP